MNECESCILFAHHCNNEVTNRHLELLKTFNPNSVVIPICDSTIPLDGKVQGAIDLKSFPALYKKKKKTVWFHADVQLYKWFRYSRSLKAKKYIYLEWDCLCLQPLEKFYGPVWNADAVAVNVLERSSKPNWYWFKNVHPNVTQGIAPLCGTLLSHEVLESITELYYSATSFVKEAFCEVRLPFLISKSGYKIQPMKNITRLSIGDQRWKKKDFEEFLMKYGASVFHSVKELLWEY